MAFDVCMQFLHFSLMPRFYSFMFRYHSLNDESDCTMLSQRDPVLIITTTNSSIWDCVVPYF